MYAIELTELTKKFKNRTAVDSLSFQINEGEIFSLLGQNGAGKTTTIRMLSCLCSPTSGDAKVMGRSILSNEEDVKHLIGVSPQETAVARRLSVQENLELMASVYGAARAESRRRADEMMAAFGLSDRSGDRADKLSGGMQRRLSIAMALISRPKVLFLDEPSLGLDVRARRDLWRHITAHRQEMTIILTTHYLEEAESLSDRIGVMNGGRLVALGSADDIVRQTGAASFEDAFLALTDEEVTA